jgi:hypothetical protein
LNRRARERKLRGNSETRTDEMQTQSKLIDDLARLASSALGVAAGARHEVEGQFRRQFERILADMDLVTREEFEVVRTIAETARAEQEALSERVARLEAQIAELTAGHETGGRQTGAQTGDGQGGKRARKAAPDEPTASEPVAKTGATGNDTPGTGEDEPGPAG